MTESRRARDFEPRGVGRPRVGGGARVVLPLRVERRDDVVEAVEVVGRARRAALVLFEEALGLFVAVELRGVLDDERPRPLLQRFGRPRAVSDEAAEGVERGLGTPGEDVEQPRVIKVEPGERAAGGEALGVA